MLLVERPRRLCRLAAPTPTTGAPWLRVAREEEVEEEEGARGLRRSDVRSGIIGAEFDRFMIALGLWAVVREKLERSTLSSVLLPSSNARRTLLRPARLR